jgi:hypothetical protein
MGFWDSINALVSIAKIFALLPFGYTGSLQLDHFLLYGLSHIKSMFLFKISYLIIALFVHLALAQCQNTLRAI